MGSWGKKPGGMGIDIVRLVGHFNMKKKGKDGKQNRKGNVTISRIFFLKRYGGGNELKT